jgi:hypothetical protein
LGVRNRERGVAVVFYFAVRGHRLLREGGGVIFNLWIGKRSLRIIAPPNIATATVANRTDKWRMQRFIIGRRELQRHHIVEQPEVICVEPFHAAEVVHRKIAKHRDGSALERLKTHQRKVGIFRPALAGHVVPITARVHRGAHGGITKGIVADLARSLDPTPQRCEFIRIKHRRTHLRWFQIFLRSVNRLHNLAL